MNEKDLLIQKLTDRIIALEKIARKQGWNIFDSIHQVVRGCPPIPV